MAVALRLKRTGRRNRPFYRICVFDTRTRRDGRSIEELGWYDPVGSPKGEVRFELNAERAAWWLSVGARPSETVASLLKRKGVEIPRRRKGGPKKAAADAS